MKCPDKDIISHCILISVFIFLYYSSCIFLLGKRNFLPLPQFKFGNADKHTEQFGACYTGKATKKRTSYFLLPIFAGKAHKRSGRKLLRLKEKVK